MTECKDRGLSTARAVLSVLSFVSARRTGVSAREVADHLQKSLSTAYHLLASLEAEGFIARVGRAGRYQLVSDKLTLVPSASGPADPLSRDALSPDALSPDAYRTLQARMRQVFALTGRRTCMSVLREDGVDCVQDVGRQGLPRLGNLERPRILATAHAVAVGKLLLAGFEQPALQRWQDEHGLRRLTPATIVDPAALRRELDAVRERGVATDRGEYDEDFGSLAVPLVTPDGRSVAAIAVTVTRHQFDAERDGLEAALRSVTREFDATGVG